MRRFIAYMGLCVLGLVAVTTTFNSAFTQTTSNIEYSDGRALTFRVSEIDDPDSEVSEGAAEEIAAIMEERLQTYGATKYDVYTQGDDTVKVVLSEELSDYYEQIQVYLSFNGAFALGTSTNVVAIGDEFMDTSEEAYVTFVNYYPTVVIPVNTDSEAFLAVIEEAERIAEEVEATTSSSDDEDEDSDEEEEDTTTYVYLAYNFVEGEDSISELLSDSEDYDEDKAEKLLMQFDISRIWSDDDQVAIASSVNIDTDSDGVINVSDVSYGTQLANYYVNLLNSEELPYDVTFLFEDTVTAYFENVLSYGMRETTAMSRTLIATIFAIIIISLLLAIVYRYAAIAIGTVSLCSTYLALLLSIVFSVEFNTAMIFGLVLVALASIACGIVYVAKVREECYRGRSLKKANAEGAKRALLPIIDINVIVVIIGAIFYWLGGDMMVSFGASCIFGGIASLILNVLILKGLMWLLTNTTKFTNKYSIIGVKENNVPNILNEEKQEYYGSFQNSDFTKYKKPVFIVGLVLFVASIIGCTTFGVLNDGNLFNYDTNSVGNTYLYFETSTSRSAMTTTYIQNLLSNTVLTYEDGTTEALIDDDFDFVNQTTTYTRDETKEGVTTTYTYIVVDLGREIDGDTMATLTIDGTEYTDTISVLLSDYIESSDIDIYASASLKTEVHYSTSQPDWTLVVISCSVAMAFVSLYFMLRYGLSRGLVSFVMSGVVGFLCVGFFALTRISTSMEILVALPVVIGFCYIAMLLFANKEKEMLTEEFSRSKDHSIEKREEIMKRATSLSASLILVFGVIGLYLTINFFGFGTSATTLYYILALIGVVISVIFVLVLYGYCSHYVYKLERRLGIKLPNLKSKRKRKTVKAKSSEPEEAIFIGIND